MSTEIYANSLVTRPNIIPLTGLLERLKRGGFIPGTINELQAVLDNDNLTPKKLAKLASIAFGTCVASGDVYLNNFPIDKRDQFFAQQFGFTILPLAYAKLDEGQVEVWIQPTLISEEHTLAQSQQNNSVVVNVDSTFSKPELKPIKPYNETIAAHYVRLTVKDQPRVLAQVAKKFGDANISIKGIFQPEAKSDSQEAEIAFMFWPCPTQTLLSTLASIKQLEVVLQENAVFRVLL